MYFENQISMENYYYVKNADRIWENAAVAIDISESLKQICIYESFVYPNGILKLFDTVNTFKNILNFPPIIFAT